MWTASTEAKNNQIIIMPGGHRWEQGSNLPRVCNPHLGLIAARYAWLGLGRNIPQGCLH